jgi:hypothetical protein
VQELYKRRNRQHTCSSVISFKKKVWVLSLIVTCTSSTPDPDFGPTASSRSFQIQQSPGADRCGVADTIFLYYTLTILEEAEAAMLGLAVKVQESNGDGHAQITPGMPSHDQVCHETRRSCQQQKWY